MSVIKKTLSSAFRVKPVVAAIAASAALMAPHAQAVNVSQNGLGEVLLFPYYTVNNGFDTNISITNTSENAVVFKIRFREAHNSRDARDFNVVLSPYDVWNATITESPDGTVARLVTGDTSCTAGELAPLNDGTGRRYVDFTNFDYITQTGVGPNDGGPTDLSRTKEGYIEVIQMGHQQPTNPGAASPDLTFAAASVGHNSKHVDGVPRDCNAVRNAFSTGNIAATAAAFYEPINVLKGTASLVKATEGKAISYDPTVLANFYNPGAGNVDGAGALNQNLVVIPESTLPGLHQAVPPVAEVIDNAVGATVIDDFVVPVNAVSAVLSRTAVVNQFSVNPVNNAKTDWVVTFPTKYYYVDSREPTAPASAVGDARTAAAAPFDDASTFQSIPVGCSDVQVGFRFFDREEDERVSVSGVGFSPAPPGVPADTICYESQVITFANSSVFGSPLQANVAVDAAGYNSGWMRLNFTNAGDLTGNTAGAVFTGLPVIGFAATTLENGMNASAVLNYGMGWSHGYVTDITP